MYSLLKMGVLQWQLVLVCLFLCSSMVSVSARPIGRLSVENRRSQRGLLAGSVGTACPLQFPDSSLAAISTFCNATGQPDCCGQVAVSIAQARATYANMTGTIYLSQTQAQTCLAALQSQTYVKGGSTAVLNSCNVTATTFQEPASIALQATQSACGDYSALTSFINSHPAIQTVCSPDYNLNATFGQFCNKACTFQGQLDSSLIQLLLGSPNSCRDTDALQVALIAKAPSALASSRIATCLYDPKETTNCTALDWSALNYPAIQAQCASCINGSGISSTCSQASNAASTQCCNGIASGAGAVWALYAAAHTDNMFPPALQAWTCFDEYQNKLAAAGIPRAIPTSFCGVSRDTFSTLYGGCNGLLSVSDYAATTNNFVGFNKSCSTDTCEKSKCFAGIFGSAQTVSTTTGAVTTNVIGCAQTLSVAFASRLLPNYTALEGTLSCIAGPFVGPILAQDAPQTPSPTWESKSGGSPAAYVGAALGAVVLLLAVALVLIYVYRRHRSELGGSSQKSLVGPSGITQYLFTKATSGTSNPLEGRGPFLVPRDQALGKKPPRKSDRESMAALERLADLLTAAPRGVQGITATGYPSLDGGGGSGHATEAVRSEPALFTYKQLQDATEDFAPSRLVGEGGFGRVYSAELDGRKLAVKRLESVKGDQQGEKQFRVEVDMMNRLAHPHLLPLVGYCSHTGQRLLVYPFMKNGSLQQNLHDETIRSTRPLDWPTRLHIALSAARALTYLHDEVVPQVIHRDFKSSNILLDEKLVPVVSDFGLAKPMAEGSDTKVSTKLFGTAGYMPPEYVKGILTEKNDVYAFGVVLLELISGRLPLKLDAAVDEQDIVDWATPFFHGERGLDLMLDPLLGDSCHLPSLVMTVEVAAACTSTNPTERPSMASVCHALFVILQQAPRSSTPSTTRSSPYNTVPIGYSSVVLQRREPIDAVTGEDKNFCVNFNELAGELRVITTTKSSEAGSGPIGSASSAGRDSKGWVEKTISMTTLVTLLEKQRNEVPKTRGYPAGEGSSEVPLVVP